MCRKGYHLRDQGMQPVQRFVSRCAGAKSPKSRPQPGKGSPDRGEHNLRGKEKYRYSFLKKSQRKFCVFLLKRGISDEKGEFGKQKQEKLCKIWGINDDETNYILTKRKRHKIIKKLSKSVDKRGILGYNNIRRR